MRILLLFLVSVSVGASHFFIQIGWFEGKKVYKRGNKCYFVIQDEFEQNVDCKQVGKNDSVRKNKSTKN